MKKYLVLSLVAMFVISSSAYARTTYNSDNTIKESSTIRAQQKLREEQKMLKKEMEQKAAQAAAAAKINYEEDKEEKVEFSNDF